MNRVSAVLLCLLIGAASLADEPVVVRGKVVDISGKPVANAEVTAQNRSKGGLQVARTLTDPSGAFSFKLTPAKEKLGYAGLLVLADGYGWGRGGADLSQEPMQDVAITLVPEQKVRGRVVDEDGKPVYDAKVTVVRARAYSSDTVFRSELNFETGDWRICDTTTGTDGTFVISHLPSSEVMSYNNAVIGFSKQGRATVTKTIENEHFSDELAVTLPRECALAGTLYLPGRAGTAPKGFPLLLKPADGDYGETRELFVGRDGRFVIGQLAPVKYDLAMGPNYMSGSRWEKDRGLTLMVPDQPGWVFPVQKIEIAPDEAKIVEVVASHGAVITGTVVNADDNSPLPNSVVMAYHAGRINGATCALTNAKGEYSVRVVPGDVRVSVHEVLRDGKKGKWIWTSHEPMEAGTALKVVEGETKAGVVLEAKMGDEPASDEQPDEGQAMLEKARRTPATSDLVLKAGTCQMTWDPKAGQGVIHMADSSKTDEDVRKLITNVPKLISEKAKFLAFSEVGSVGSGMMLAIMDESHGTGTGFDTIYIDCNRNSDLSDDAPVKMPRKGSYQYAYSAWTEAIVSRVGSEAQYGGVRLRYYVNPTTSDIGLCVAGAWRGKIDSNKGSLDSIVSGAMMPWWKGARGYHTTMLSDYQWGEGDSLYIDTNGFGQAVEGWDSPHTVRLDSPSRVASRYYDITMSSTGNRVTVKPYAGKLGSFKVTSSGIAGFAAKPTEICLYNDHRKYTIDLTRTPAVFPAGTYKMDHCTMDLENSKGEQTTIRCATHDKLTILPNKTTALDISGSISMEIAPGATYLTLDPGAVSHINVRTKIGKKITLLTVGDKSPLQMSITSWSDRGGALKPQLQLVDKNGKTVFSGKADDQTWSIWLSDVCKIKLPTIAPGIYTCKLTADTRSPLGKLTAQKKALIRDPAYGADAKAYNDAVAAKDSAKAVALRRKLLDKYFTWRIECGKPYEVTYRNYGEYLPEDQLSAVVKFYVEKDYLRAVADVTDAYLSTFAVDDYPHRASSIEFWIDPTGTPDATTALVVIPEGKGGAPRVFSLLKTVKASYKLTSKGYHVDLRIPWKSIKDYREDWRLMPIGVELTSRTGKARAQLQFTKTTEIFSDPRGFAALVRPGGK